MSFSLQVLNSDATLNHFHDIGSFRFASDEDVDILMRIIQDDKEDLRYIPDGAASIEFAFMKSDESSITKTASFPFADDRSIIKISFTAAETAELISQDLIAEITEVAKLRVAVLQGGLQRIVLTDC